MSKGNSNVKMVDISEKSVTLREALAEARIHLQPKTLKLIREKKIPKGDVLAVAKCAGISAAKKTGELIPLCHPLPLESAQIDFIFKKGGIIIKARCKTQAKTGVEMEAMVACSIAALTVYDMCKSIDRGAVIEEIKLMEKRGGKSGHYKRR
ncbi:MAG: molybdenum cofactor biosynthesis protein C [Omnitrophica WOR_2 bacterium RBG_13_44_8b]|nr:MAG: molybdenum cofactor biosynthesis protein C [Omnitrophica WOR_2 bacterium RBG_13_44_8b]